MKDGKQPRLFLDGWNFTAGFILFEILRNSPSEVFLGEGVLKICGKSTGEHPCRNVISIKLQSMGVLL